MNIEFYGAKKEVGRSMIKVGDLFLDAGIKLGNPITFPEYNGKVNDVVITHAHLDHCGYLPHIIKNIKKIHTSKPTRDLMHLLLSDYQRIQMQNDKNDKKFLLENVSEVMAKVEMHDFGEPFDIKGSTVTLYDAGHILGSAMVKVEKNNKSILYTGDISVRGTKILKGADMNVTADELIIETTYAGDNDQIPSVKKASRELLETVSKTIADKGYIIIPTFAVGRGQNILLVLADYIRSGALENIPIYVDGMIKKANKIYRHNLIYTKKELQMRVLTSMDDPFMNNMFKTPRKKDRSDVLSNPCIIVTTSGMLTGGPVMKYLKYIGTDKSSTLCLVGYQVEGTNGRGLLDGKKLVKTKNLEIPVNMNIKQINFSAHADRSDLLNFIKHINKNKKLKKIYLVHGEHEKMLEFKKTLEKRFKFKVIIA